MDTSSMPPAAPIIYWMSRDQRVLDNWALVHAQTLAAARGAPLVVTFCLLPTYAGAPLRAYGFMLRSLRMIEADLAALGVTFRLLLGEPGEQVAAYANALRAAAVVADYCPLRAPISWKAAVATRLHAGCAFMEVDAHNIVPVTAASSKAEVGARTLRPKLHTALVSGGWCGLPPAPIHLTATLPADSEAGMRTFGVAVAASSAIAPAQASLPGASAVVLAPREGSATAWHRVLPHLRMDDAVGEVAWALPGERAAAAALDAFLARRLARYADDRNDPTKPEACSNLSPWLHFGQLSAQRVVREVMRVADRTLGGLFVAERKTPAQNFCEELVIRRELADNFCHYTPDAYDSLAGAAAWAQATLAAHAGDKRDRGYSLEQFERGETHEALWNAAQMELVHRGKLGGFMRMYWAKKILEWSASPAEALATALHLNDKYNLDGRDPNGVVGCMWAIAGVHDMGWAERAVFGKIRYMNLAGCKRKFDVDGYIAAHPVRPLPRPPQPPAPAAAVHA